jgi:uncharacterized protein YuzE
MRSKDLTRLLAIAPSLVDLPESRMWVVYDAEADVLYVGFQRPQRATDSEMRDDGVIIHRRGKRVVGLTIREASSRWAIVTRKRLAIVLVLVLAALFVAQRVLMPSPRV